MNSVRSIAERYGARTTFVIHALAKIGFPAATPDTPISAATLARFEKSFGERIRSAKPAPPPPYERTAPSAAQPRQPRLHVIRVAHTKISGRRDMQTMVRYKVLAEDPGPAHAIDASGTREGDPWRGDPAPGSHSFCEYQGPHAACGVQVKVVMGEAFDSERSDACPRCVEVVAAGKAVRLSPSERTHDCAAYLRLSQTDRVVVEECSLRDHRGPHRTYDGATWETGEDDYIPAPDGVA